MDLSTLARIHAGLDDLAADRPAKQPLATRLWQLMMLDPAYPAVYLQQGAWHLAAGDAGEAARVLAVGAAATGDVAVALRRIDCLRASGDEAGALAALVGLAGETGEVRVHWQLAAGELDGGDPRAALTRLGAVDLAVRDADDLRRKLPALLLRIDCVRALGRRADRTERYHGADAAVLAAYTAEDPHKRGRQLKAALRDDPYHAWGRYALAGVLAADDAEAARANLEVAVQGEPILAWRARRDPTFAGVSLADLDPAAELPCAPWIRVEGDHLALRTGREEAAERAWWPLPRAVRAALRFDRGARRVAVIAGPTSAGYAQLYRGLRALAPFIDAGRMFVQEEGAGWLDELRFAEDTLHIRRHELGGDDEAARQAFLAGQAKAAPKDRWLAALAGSDEVVAEDPIARLRAESERPDAPIDVFHRLGLALQEARRFDEALATYDRSIAGRPAASAGSKLNKGNVLAALRRWAEALACYDAAIAEAPRLAYAWGGRGQALRNLGRAAEAEAALREAIKLDDKFANPWLELAQLQFADGLQAVALCDEALRRKADCPYTWSTRGSALNNLGRWAEAHACYDKAIALDARYWHPYYCRACTFGLQGDREAALAAVKAALAVDPSRAAMLRGEADLIALHRDPRFIALVGRPGRSG